MLAAQPHVTIFKECVYNRPENGFHTNKCRLEWIISLR